MVRLVCITYLSAASGGHRYLAFSYVAWIVQTLDKALYIHKILVEVSWTGGTGVLDSHLETI